MIHEQYKSNVFSIASDEEFNNFSLEIFQFQYRHNSVYQAFVDGVCQDLERITHFSQIPCLPIEFFKTHTISTVDNVPELKFRSSGTTGQERSTHYIFSEAVYKESILKCFSLFYGKPSDYIICAFVPDYATHQESSLAYMLDYLIKLSDRPQSGFYWGNVDDLIEILQEYSDHPKIIFGITYALIHFADKYQSPLKNTVIIETGGMKGQSKEVIRPEVHSLLTNSFSCPVHSEYSMAELMSQAYSKDGNTFSPPAWMKILIREVHDPLSLAAPGKTGGINIIDLANFHTCPFIATKDLGVLHTGGSFEVLGRFDYSDIRGCNLLASEL